jgi:hypothetical protein
MKQTNGTGEARGRWGLGLLAPGAWHGARLWRVGGWLALVGGLAAWIYADTRAVAYPGLLALGLGPVIASPRLAYSLRSFAWLRRVYAGRDTRFQITPYQAGHTDEIPFAFSLGAQDGLLVRREAITDGPYRNAETALPVARLPIDPRAGLRQARRLLLRATARLLACLIVLIAARQRALLAGVIPAGLCFVQDDDGFNSTRWEDDRGAIYLYSGWREEGDDWFWGSWAEGLFYFSPEHNRWFVRRLSHTLSYPDIEDRLRGLQQRAWTPPLDPLTELLRCTPPGGGVFVVFDPVDPAGQGD